MKRRIKHSIIILTCAIGCAVLGFSLNKYINLQQESEVEIGAPFKLTRHTGGSVTDEFYRGKYMFFYFGFTHCPATCPTTLLKMTNVLNQLENIEPRKADKVVPIFISVDPDRDSPEIIGRYISHFHNRFDGLTGTLKELQDLVNSYGSYFSFGEKDEYGNYEVYHSSLIYFIGPNGRYVTHFDPNVSVEEIVTDLKQRVT